MSFSKRIILMSTFIKLKYSTIVAQNQNVLLIKVYFCHGYRLLNGRYAKKTRGQVTKNDCVFDHPFDHPFLTFAENHKKQKEPKPLI